MHRADLHDALLSVLPAEIIHLGQEARRPRAGAAGGVTLTFADGSRAQADAVIGADGVHSVVRDIIVGPDAPLHKGRIAYRAVFPSALDERPRYRAIAHQVVGHRPPHRHLLHERERSEVYFVTSVPEPAEWLTRESWSAKGDVNELREAYEGFHPDVRAVLEACPDCHKWAILEREPLARWSEGRVVAAGRCLLIR